MLISQQSWPIASDRPSYGHLRNITFIWAGQLLRLKIHIKVSLGDSDHIVVGAQPIVRTLLDQHHTHDTTPEET